MSDYHSGLPRGGGPSPPLRGASYPLQRNAQGPFAGTSSYARQGAEMRGGGGRGMGQRSYDGGASSHSAYGRRDGERPPFHARGLAGASALEEEGPRTKLSSYVNPHEATQEQPAQHGASVVRSGSAATEGGSILFFSSVQKKGGAFTASERETYAQLHRSRAIPNVNRGRNAGNVSGSGVSAKSMERQFAQLEKEREANALAAVRKAAAVGVKRSRFTLEESSSEEEG